jgi:hypothetical protein
MIVRAFTLILQPFSVCRGVGEELLLLVLPHREILAGQTPILAELLDEVANPFLILAFPLPQTLSTSFALWGLADP